MSGSDHGPDLTDVPSMLRLTADDIDAGKYGDVRGAALALKNSTGHEAFGFGRIRESQFAGLFFRGFRISATASAGWLALVGAMGILVGAGIAQLIAVVVR